MSNDFSSRPLRYWVETSVTRYFDALDGSEPTGIYAMVLKEVHTGLLRALMQMTQGNQSKAAAYLGISRGTLRKLIAEHDAELVE